MMYTFDPRYIHLAYDYFDTENVNIFKTEPMTEPGEYGFDELEEDYIRALRTWTKDKLLPAFKLTAEKAIEFLERWKKYDTYKASAPPSSWNRRTQFEGKARGNLPQTAGNPKGNNDILYRRRQHTNRRVFVGVWQMKWLAEWAGKVLPAFSDRLEKIKDDKLDMIKDVEIIQLRKIKAKLVLSMKKLEAKKARYEELNMWNAEAAEKIKTLVSQGRTTEAEFLSVRQKAVYTELEKLYKVMQSYGKMQESVNKINARIKELEK